MKAALRPAVAAAGLLAWLGLHGVLAQTPVATPTPAPPANVVTSLTLFAGTKDGLWRTRDWGVSWQKVGGAASGVSLEPAGAVSWILPLGPQVYLGAAGGYYVSTDFGETWERRSEEKGLLAVLPSRWPAADPTVWAGRPSGLMRSVDDGRSFRPTAVSVTPVTRLDWPGPHLVMSTGLGVLMTPDGGQTFTGPGAGWAGGPATSFALSSFFPTDPVLFAAPASGGVMRSEDAGRTWKPTGLGGERVGDLVWLGPFLYAAGDAGFHRSEDAGAKWERLSASPGAVRRLLFPLAPAAGLEAFLATDKGLFRTPDAGKSWSPAGFAGEEVLTVATFPPPAPLAPRKKR
jgi:photosystem II stability/assembly factor-like uncharacterized protein